jgi:hypothetical protein
MPLILGNGVKRKILAAVAKWHEAGHDTLEGFNHVWG